ncbi:MAG: pyruvate dehydrogenase (acetyl-transferring) E1 component subunit alpha [Planctomycetota bacterium]|nr:MAG: pyruvate dehydrogenase (acetyl-transferring) E1 component subunit alpha [Planctomycetota bacterium]
MRRRSARSLELPRRRTVSRIPAASRPSGAGGDARDRRRSNVTAVQPLQLLSPEGGASVEPPEGLDPERLLSLYRNMVRLRVFDRRALNLQRQGRINFYAPASGQEAAMIGSAAALEPQDVAYPTYRESGVCLQRGMSLRTMADQLFGNARDLVKGRQMPNHWSSREHNIVSISSCIATQIPQAAGTGMAQRFRGENAATICYFGDGATSEGDFHAGLNFAGVFRANTVFFCQNNQWAITVPVTRQTAAPSIAIKASAYGFEGIRIDGNDLLVVYKTVREALEKARSGGGPTLIEALTYRMGPHSTSDDPRRYRTEQEVETWRRRDPIERLQRYLEARGWIDAEQVERIAAEAKEEVDRAISEAEAVGPPEPETLFEDVYARPTPQLERERRELLDLIRRGVVSRVTHTPIRGS